MPEYLIWDNQSKMERNTQQKHLVLHRFVRRPKSSQKTYDAKTQRYIRSGGRSNAQRGVVVALIQGDTAYFGWSLCNTGAGDVYNKRQGYQLALGMASQLMLDPSGGVGVVSPLDRLVVAEDGGLTLPILSDLVKNKQIPHSVSNTMRDHINYVVRRVDCKQIVIGTSRLRQMRASSATPLPVSTFSITQGTPLPIPNLNETKEDLFIRRSASAKKAAATRLKNKANKVVSKK